MIPHPQPPRIFHTERLTLRAPDPCFAKQHLAAVLESRDQLRLWMPWALEEPSFESTYLNLAQAAERFSNGEDFRLLIFLRDTETLVGGSGLHQPNWEAPSFEIGYWVRRNYGGQGYITEAVRGITETAFYKLGAERTEIRTSTRNEPSIAVAKRAGYALEGILRKHGRHLDRTLRDTMIFAKVRQSISVAGTDPFREMTAADLPSVLALWKATDGVGLSEGDALDDLLKQLERNPACSFVATGACSEIVGAVLAGHDGRRGFLYHLAVAPSHRRRGYGRALVDRSLKALSAVGIQKCSLMLFSHNDTGGHFWKVLGWSYRGDLRVLQKSLTQDSH